VDNVFEVFVGVRQFFDDLELRAEYLFANGIDVFLTPEGVVGFVLEFCVDDPVNFFPDELAPIVEDCLVGLAYHQYII
jgi:hypothetical protein